VGVKSTILFKKKSTIDLQFETDILGKHPAICKPGVLPVGGERNAPEREDYLHIPTPEQALSGYSHTLTPGQHAAFNY
jgi:hypothetical protein